MFFLCMQNVFTPNRNKAVFTSNVNSGLQYNTIQYNTILILSLFYSMQLYFLLINIPRRRASGYVLIRCLQSALIPFVTTQSVGVLTHAHE